jgi:sigma-B regulation protein RsbU (phosphoserine phosphatase)
MTLQRLKQWFASEHTKTTLAVLITAAVLIEITAVVQYHFASEGIRNEVSHRAEAELRVKNLEIARVMTTVETAARSTAWMIKQRIGKADDVVAVMRHMLENNTGIEGCGIGFVANYYKDKGQWYELYINRLPNDSLETKQIGSQQHDYLKAEWFAKPFSTGKAYWTEPYYDDAGGKALMVTYAMPICDDSGKTVAVFGIDLSLEWLSRVLNASHIYPSSYNLIISRKGQLMACPVESLIMRHNIQEVTSNMDDTTAKHTSQRMMEGQTGQATVIDDNGEKNYVFFAPIKSDTTMSQTEHLGWSMAVVCSDREIYHSLRQVGFNLMLMMLAGLALLTFIMFRSIHSIRRIQSLNEERSRIDSELSVASRIQQAMLPKDVSERDDLNIHAMLTPAREVGGDLYDCCLRNEKLFFCIGDVAGKGVPAAIIMAMAQSAFRMLTERESSPERIVSQMNNTLARDNDYNIFITFFMGVLDIPTGRLRYCNAGHKPPLIISEDKTCHVMNGGTPMSNLPLGAMPDWKYTTQEVMIEPGTTIFLYTDGLTEAEDNTHKQFGEERMRLCCNTNSPQQLIQQMSEAVQSFIGDTEQSDDLTMLAINYSHRHNDNGKQWMLTLPNDVSQTPRLAEFVEQVCEAVGLATTDTMQVNLAIEEAVVNVMNYAYPKGQEGIIDILAEANDSRMKFTITDGGQPFDPTTMAEVDTTLSAEERSIGGLGIHLIRRYMDSINYERIDNKNILTLRKKITK